MSGMESSGQLDRSMLFADGTADYRIPEEPDAGDEVILRFRAARTGLDRVLIINGKTGAEREMELAASDSLFDYYEIKLMVGQEPLPYWFRAERGDAFCFFNRLGAVDEAGKPFAFLITPGFHTPSWAKGAVMYQIFVDRFRNGNPENDVVDSEYRYLGRPVVRVTDWDSDIATLDVGRFYGGDLQGVLDKLDYLQDLGIEVLYFSPLFVSPSNHKYDSQDYEHIDPHYGVIKKNEGCVLPAGADSNAEASLYRCRTADPENLAASDAFFADFMQEVHRRGMRVILDGVFNHCGSFNKWLDREKLYAGMEGYEPGAYESADSPYRSFFRFSDPTGWPDNASYRGWWDHATLPKLNYEDSPGLGAYILGIARKWVRAPYSIDGWRLDVAADLGSSPSVNHRFWQDFRRAVKEENPEALILAEHYGDPSAWLAGDEWDTVMNYDAFMEPVTWFLTGMEKHSDAFDEKLFGDGEAFFALMAEAMAHMQTQSVFTAMNQLSNHDHSRFMTRTNRTVGRLASMGAGRASEGIRPAVYRTAVLIQMTWPGAPTLYYGDEAGLCGWTDPDNRRPYPWGREDLELIEFHRYMINMHKRCPALRSGSLIRLAAGRHFVAYGRMKGKSRGVVVVNNLHMPLTVKIPLRPAGITDDEVLVRRMFTSRSGYNVGRVICRPKDGFLSLTLPDYASAFFTAESGEPPVPAETDPEMPWAE